MTPNYIRSTFSNVGRAKSNPSLQARGSGDAAVGTQITDTSIALTGMSKAFSIDRQRELLNHM
jgi:hypothetical protein